MRRNVDVSAGISIPVCGVEVGKIQYILPRSVSNEDVLWFDITVYKVLRVDCLKASQLLMTMKGIS
jgi:hypothetical protein